MYIHTYERTNHERWKMQSDKRSFVYGISLLFFFFHKQVVLFFSFGVFFSQFPPGIRTNERTKNEWNTGPKFSWKRYFFLLEYWIDERLEWLLRIWQQRTLHIEYLCSAATECLMHTVPLTKIGKLIMSACACSFGYRSIRTTAFLI